jgi:arginase
MGRGATRLCGDEPLRAGIEAAGWTVSSEEIDAVQETAPEIARVSELIRRLATRVLGAVDAGSFPLVIAGNCNSSLGTVAGVGADRLGVVWFDAHADFDDPEENTSGFFDVMGLAMLTGRGWAALRRTIPGHDPIDERNVVLAGVRDLEPYQRRRLERSQVHTVPYAIEPDLFEHSLRELSTRATRIYLHVDLDALDVSQARANQYAAAGGPALERLSQCIHMACERFPVAAAAITAYDPAFDHGDRALSAARRIAADIAEGARVWRRA